VREGNGGPKEAGVRSWSWSATSARRSCTPGGREAGPPRAVRGLRGRPSAPGRSSAAGSGLVAAAPGRASTLASAAKPAGSTWTASSNSPARPPSSGSASSTDGQPLVQRRTRRRGHHPDRYLPRRATWTRTTIHLGTAPPDQQLTWLEYLHERGLPGAHLGRHVSSTTWPTYPHRPSREVCDSVRPHLREPGRVRRPVRGRPAAGAQGAAHRQAAGPPAPRLIVDGHPQEVEAPRRAASGPDRRRRGCWPACSSRCGPTGCRERLALRYAVPRRGQLASADYGVTGSPPDRRSSRRSGARPGNTGPG